MLEASLVLEIVLHKATEAAIIAALLVVNAILSFTQEHRAQQALALLRSRLTVMTRVRRDGDWALLRAEDIVPGDVVYVRMGDIIPADLKVAEGAILLDQSSLTGESAPVEARVDDRVFAGSVVRRGEATGVVEATGPRTYFGKTAELVGRARSASQLEALVLGIVKYLVALDGVLAGLVVAYALARSLPFAEVVPFTLMLLIASVPVALPATFTLATALGSVELVRRGVLVTRLAAVEEAAAMQVLCSDKTGTLTENRLTLASAHPSAPLDRDELLQLAAFACDEATKDPLDVAILAARPAGHSASPATRLEFTPFDPATKRAEALVRRSGETIRVVKGAPQAVTALVEPRVDVRADVDRLGADGDRVLAVAAGPEGRLRFAGLLAFVDPPRPESSRLIERLRGLGVRVLMVTGDTVATAASVARQLGVGDRVASAEHVARAPLDFDVFAGVLPEDKFQLVRALQSSGCVVGMTGDGVNDAPALKQAEVGIAVASATDVARAAASIVLTQAGLEGIVAAIETGRRIYQRMLTYTLNKIIKTIEIALFLSIGLFATGALVTSPRLILLLLFTNDFVTMSIAGDRVSFSPKPDRWNVRSLVLSASVLAAAWLAFSLGVLFVGARVLHLSHAPLQTLAFLVLVFGGQANVYLVRERGRFWASMPSPWMLVATTADLLIVAVLASTGTWMAPLAPSVVGALLLAAVVFMSLVDIGKVRLFARTADTNGSTIADDG
jgi:H+-transporting ATPase